MTVATTSRNEVIGDHHHPLTVEIKRVDQVTLVTFEGVVNEDNNLLEIVDKIDTSVAIINTAQIERINSPGVRDWVHWMAELDKRGVRSFFVECSPSIMAQVNLVINFIGQGTILSFNAPFYCTSCNANRLVLLSLEEILENEPVRIPTRRCEECDHLLEFDERESFFFSFLSWAKVGPLDPALAKTLHEVTSRFVSGQRPKTDRFALDSAPSFQGSDTPTKDIPLFDREDTADHQAQNARTRPGEEPPMRTGFGAEALESEPRSTVTPVVWAVVGVLTTAVALLVYLASRI